MLLIILILIAVVYCCLPWYIEFACFIINLFIPDTIPLIDELLMFVPIVSKIKNIITISELLRKYGKIILAIILILLGGVVMYFVFIR